MHYLRRLVHTDLLLYAAEICDHRAGYCEAVGRRCALLTILHITDSSPADGGRLNDELRYSAEIKKIKNLDVVPNLTDEEKRLRLEELRDGSLSEGEDRGMPLYANEREENHAQEMEACRAASPYSYRRRDVLA